MSVRPDTFKVNAAGLLIDLPLTRRQRQSVRKHYRNLRRGAGRYSRDGARAWTDGLVLAYTAERVGLPSRDLTLSDTAKAAAR